MPVPIDVSFTSARGVRIFAQTWTPAAPRAVILLVHGYGEHHGRYAHVIDHLVSAGYAVAALDHQGHGRSEGERVFIDSLFTFTADLHQFRHTMSARYAGLPVIVFGHSMGGLITLTYTIQYGDGLAGAIACASPVLPEANVPRVLVLIGRVLNRIAPRLPLLEPAPLTALSRDPAVIAAFEADPLTYKGKMKVGLGMAIGGAAEFVRANLHRLTVPILFLHGVGDPFVAVAGTKLAYAGAASRDKTLKLYPDLYHEILNEPERDQVLADITDWLKQRYG